MYITEVNSGLFGIQNEMQSIYSSVTGALKKKSVRLWFIRGNHLQCIWMILHHSCKHVQTNIHQWNALADTYTEYRMQSMYHLFTGAY